MIEDTDEQLFEAVAIHVYVDFASDVRGDPRMSTFWWVCSRRMCLTATWI